MDSNKLKNVARMALLLSFAAAANAQIVVPPPGYTGAPAPAPGMPGTPGMPTTPSIGGGYTTGVGTPPTVMYAQPAGMLASAPVVQQLPTAPYTPTMIPPPFSVINPTLPIPPAPLLNPQPPAPLTVFGSQMFSGRFAAVTYTGFNPGYQVAIGDQVSVRLWGAVAFDAVESVDAQGNLFVPNVGPIHVQGVRNSELTTQVESQVKKTYKSYVGVYASLIAAQPVKVYVTGFVRAPGLYPGLSSDSVLYYIDRAGGIDTDRGTFLEVDVMRDGKVRAAVDLYKFLLTGQIQEMQMHDGDTIVIGARHNTIPVYGNVQNPYLFELPGSTIKARDLLKEAIPLPGSTHLALVRAVGLQHQSFYYPLDQLDDITLQTGDQINITADQYPVSILVKVTGAQAGPKNFVLPVGAKIGDLLGKLTPATTANMDAVQLFRPSVAAMQKASIDNTLQALQTAALTARNATLSEAQTRSTEATLIMQYIDRAKLIVPKGQVVLTSKDDTDNTLLEDGDTVNVPEFTNLVDVSGEVQLPNTLVFKQGRRTNDYVALVGGYTQRADRTKVLVMRQNGSVAPSGSDPLPGDTIMVLPTIETKYIEVASGITSILYQLAVAANVLTTLR